MVAVIIGFRLMYGELDFFYGFFALLLAPEFYQPLRNMGTHYHARMEAIGAAEKMLEVLEPGTLELEDGVEPLVQVPKSVVEQASAESADTTLPQTNATKTATSPDKTDRAYRWSKTGLL